MNSNCCSYVLLKLLLLKLFTISIQTYGQCFHNSQISQLKIYLKVKKEMLCQVSYLNYPIFNILAQLVQSIVHQLLSVNKTHQFSSVQSLICIRLFATPWTAARQASLSITNSWSLLTVMSITSVMPSNRFILC